MPVSTRHERKLRRLREWTGMVVKTGTAKSPPTACMSHEERLQANASLNAYWQASDLHGAAISDADLATLAARVGPLPEAYRAFALSAGRQRDADPEGLFFWPPEEIRRADEVVVPMTPALRGALVVADYREESWWYVLWTDGPRAGLVGLATGQGDEEREPVGTLEDFVRAVVEHSAILYP